MTRNQSLSNQGGGVGNSAPEVADITKRSVPLWVGSSPDAAIPKRVKLRIWEREGGRCWLTGKKIMPGDAYDFDHKVALCNGGRHAEDNLFLALRAKHREKTVDDVAERVKTERTRLKHLGLWGKGQPIKSRGFDKRRWPA